MNCSSEKKEEYLNLFYSLSYKNLIKSKKYSTLEFNERQLRSFGIRYTGEVSVSVRAWEKYQNLKPFPSQSIQNQSKQQKHVPASVLILL